MTYEEMFSKVKEAVQKIDASKIRGHYAFQVDIIGEGAGIFYVEITDGTIKAEPYDYINHDAKFTASANEIINIFTGKQDPMTSLTLGRLNIDGNYDKASVLKDLLPN